MTDALDPEDAKLVTLARGARARIAAASGAALRDETGRTYAAADVSLPSLALSALALAVAQAVSAGSRAAEAAVVVGREPTSTDLDVLRELGGPGIRVLHCSSDGSVVGELAT
jgi:hypothetical protein